jgi:hypothetical protein
VIYLLEFFSGRSKQLQVADTGMRKLRLRQPPLQQTSAASRIKCVLLRFCQRFVIFGFAR